MDKENNLQEEQLQHALLTNYLANLAFLSEYDNELFKRLEALSRSIESGDYQIRYNLEFMKDNGDFDVLDIKNNIYIYNKKPKIYNRRTINNVDFNGTHSIKVLEKSLYKPGFQKLDAEKIKKLKTTLQDPLPSVQLLRSDITEYIEIFDKEMNFKKIKRIEKFIFFGTLLGRHINPIAEKVNATSYFVCEKNLELFRLSLFVNDYKNLAKNKGVVFSIMDDEEETNKKIGLFLSHAPFSNYLLKFSSTGRDGKKYIESFLTSLVYKKPTTFAYNRILYTIVRNKSEKINNYRSLIFKKNGDYNFFNNTPVLFVAGGPSLQEKFDWIKENQKKFFIVAVGASYKTLKRNGIHVNMIITLDASYDALNEKQFSEQDVKDYMEDTIVLASSITDKRLLDRFSQEKLFTYEVGHSFFGDDKPLPAYSVGEQSVALLLSMNIKELYIIGLDLALNQNTGSSHGSSSDSSTKSHNLDDNDLSTFGFNTGIIKIKGNFRDEVSTTSSFKASKLCLDFIIKERKKIERNIYNLSNNGAFFEDTIPLKTEDININDYNEISLKDIDIIDFLSQNSQTHLSEDALKDIEKEINFIKNISLSKDKEFNTYEEFYHEITSLINLLCFKNENTTMLPSILKNYFEIVLNYLAAMFNDKTIKKEKIKIQKVNKVFFSQLESLLVDYINYLEDIKKPKLK